MDAESVRMLIWQLSNLAERAAEWAGYLEDSFFRDGYIAGEFTQQDVDSIRRCLLPVIERTAEDMYKLLEE
jgi:hypothetical protein